MATTIGTSSVSHRCRSSRSTRRGGRRAGAKPIVDSKIGFCFYDHSQELSSGLADRHYSAKSCGDRKDTVIGMGLSPGWNDTYSMTLPGQSIDVSGLADGGYRLFTAIDEKGWFREATRDNNRTWIDIDLRTTAKGLIAPTTGTGPRPS